MAGPNPGFRVPAAGWRFVALWVSILLAQQRDADVSAVNTTAYCTRNFNVNETSVARITPLPRIKMSIVVEKNSGTIDVYGGQGNLTVIRGDGIKVWDRIEKFSNANKDGMIMVLRNNVGKVNVYKDEQLSEDDYYYDTTVDREKNGEVVEVAHFGQNKGLMEISAGASNALFVILADKAAAKAALAPSADNSTSATAKPTAFLPFAATDTSRTHDKPLKLETCNLYELMDVNSAKCYDCPVVSRGGGTLKVSASQCVHKVSEICSCGVFKQGGKRCVKRVIANQCRHTVPSDDQFSAEVMRQYGRYCQSRGKND
jgi:hypothetical protein